MQIWLDTIDEEVIKEGVNTGVISGITTNPSILSKAENVIDKLQNLLDLQSGPIAVQVTSTEPKMIIEEAKSLYNFSPRIIIKIAINPNGLKAIKQLKSDGIPILGTGILTPSQALLALNHNIEYIAPYFGHMEEPKITLKIIADIIKSTASNTKILVASLRELDHLIYCASLGINAATLKPDLFYKLIAKNPSEERITEKFLSDWKQSQGMSYLCSMSHSELPTSHKFNSLS